MKTSLVFFKFLRIFEKYKNVNFLFSFIFETFYYNFFFLNNGFLYILIFFKVVVEAFHKFQFFFI